MAGIWLVNQVLASGESRLSHSQVKTVMPPRDGNCKIAVFYAPDFNLSSNFFLAHGSRRAFIDKVAQTNKLLLCGCDIKVKGWELIMFIRLFTEVFYQNLL